MINPLTWFQIQSTSLRSFLKQNFHIFFKAFIEWKLMSVSLNELSYKAIHTLMKNNIAIPEEHGIASAEVLGQRLE